MTNWDQFDVDVQRMCRKCKKAHIVHLYYSERAITVTCSVTDYKYQLKRYR